MKTAIRITRFFLAALLIPGFSSCEKTPDENGSGMAEFSLDLSTDLGQFKSASNDTAIISWHLLVSVTDRDGNPVITDELIPLYNFGSGYVSEKLELPSGEYRLVRFMVINTAGEVIYATPVAGSPLAYLVHKPLPVPFRIHPGQVTILAPEVLPVGDHPPQDFGYVAFGVQVIRPLGFYVVCILDNPMIAAPTLLTTAKLTVFGPNNWHYTFFLEAKVNHLVIRGGSEVYQFLLEKEGYEPQKMQFTATRLKATTPENPLVLTIPWGPGTYKLLELQPGPERGMDAMISNLDPEKNFGDHKYFEATYLTEPILTVMRANRSLIRFDMNELPKSARIHKVELQLFFEGVWAVDNGTATGGDTSYDARGAVLQQVLGPWEEHEVTWLKQPPTTAAYQVYVPYYYVTNANHVILDVTRLYLNNLSTSAMHYGMMFRQYPTEHFPGFRFASSDYPVAAMRPKLKIYYTLP